MGNAASGLPYDNGAPIDYSQICTHWQLSSGTKKEDKEDKDQVTIFKFLKTQTDKLPVASKNFQKLRTLKHPYILSFLDGADMDDAIVLVTEICIPLELWIQQQIAERNNESSVGAAELALNTSQEVIWGFRCIINALQFLHSTCTLIHGYLGLHAIFVSKNGDWKLGALDLAANLTNPDDAAYFNTFNHLLVRPYISPERQQPNAAVSLQAAPGAADIFALAHCMQVTFDKLKLQVPASFDKYLQRMLVVDIKKRPTAGQLAQCPIFNSEQVKLYISLGDLAIKPPSDSLEILGNLTSRVPEIPRTVCIHKILPSVGRALQMALNDFSTRNARESCRQSVQLSLTLLAQLATQNKLDETNYTNKCLPIIIQLWSLNDRAIRTTLLKTLKSLIVLTPASFVNKSIFDPMLAGFADSNAKMREDTLKNLVHIVDKLDEKNLQDKLTRCISNLQNDAESSIRTNATIFLGRTASRLKEGVRARVICPAFAKAMRDPFVHCRLAGLKAAVACIELLDIPQLSGKIMPQACTLLIDRSGEIREMALSLIESGSTLLRQHHDKTLKADKLAAAASAAAGEKGGSEQSAQSGGNSWTSWVSEGLSKTIEKVAVSDDSAVEKLRQNSTAGNAAANTSSVSSSMLIQNGASTTVKSRASSSSNVSVDNDSSFIGNLAGGADDGWGDDNWGLDDDDSGAGGWGNDDDLNLSNDEDDGFSAKKPSSSKAAAVPSGTAGSLGVGNIAAESSSRKDKPIGLVSSTTSRSEIGGLSVKTSSKLAAKAKPVVKKLDKDGDGGWDDF